MPPEAIADKSRLSAPAFADGVPSDWRPHPSGWRPISNVEAVTVIDHSLDIPDFRRRTSAPLPLPLAA